MSNYITNNYSKLKYIPISQMSWVQVTHGVTFVELHHF